MRKMLKISVLLLAVGLIFCLTGCPEDDGSGDEGTIAFQSFSPASVLINNQTGERLVAFRGSVSPNNLIGGIPAYAIHHGLKRDSVLFNATGDFVLVLITEAQYKANKNSLAAATVFTRIYALYNHEVANNTVYTISASLGGSGRLIVRNPTPYNVTLHKDSPVGEMIGFAGATMFETVINLQEGNYDIFPVIRRYDPVTQEMISIIPTNGNNIPVFAAFVLSGNTTEYTFDLSDLGDVELDQVS